MRKLVLIIMLILFSSSLWSQSINISLSPAHNQKLNKFKSGHKRMMKYYKFYKNDSARVVKAINKQEKAKWDSIVKSEKAQAWLVQQLERRGLSTARQVSYADSLQNVFNTLTNSLSDSALSASEKLVAQEKLKKLSGNKLDAAIIKCGHPELEKFKALKLANQELKNWLRVYRDSTSSDSLKKVAKQKVQELAMIQAMNNPQFRALHEKYKQIGGVPGWDEINQYMPGFDSLSGIFNDTPEQFMARAENFLSQQLLQRTELGGMGSQISKFEEIKSQYSQLTNPANLKTEAQNQLKDQALDQAEGLTKNLTSAQATMSKLLSKYSSFTNAADLSTAVKRTSLQGKTFKERLVLGGNYNIVSIKPVSFDLSPLIGYRFNTRFNSGVSANYRFSFGDSLRYKQYISSANTSLRWFANYDVIKNFFAYAEVEMSGVKSTSTEKKVDAWQYNYFIAAGKKILVHPKLFMTVTALYRINDRLGNSSYPSRFTVRIGFQTSELAFRKKKIYYDRNR
jgi:hypothetical protein